MLEDLLVGGSLLAKVQRQLQKPLKILCSTRLGSCYPAAGKICPPSREGRMVGLEILHFPLINIAARKIGTFASWKIYVISS